MAVSSRPRSLRVQKTAKNESSTRITTGTNEASTFCDEKAALRAQKLLDRQLPEVRAVSMASMMSAFGDVTRLRILFLLSQSELCVCDLSALLDITQSGVSHQLSNLKNLRLIKNRRTGRNIFYSIADDHVAEILRIGLEHVQEKATR
jgi:ArsR family transcriptional regulator